MAPAVDELATLRALTFRISSTPTSQLPQHVPAISASLANCRTVLSSAQPAGPTASSPESALAVHKYRTLLSTLLQHRTIHGRWAAIVLIKATIEVGGWETLHKCLPWVRGLLGFLTKPDPPSSKKLCIITLTRIFLLTREYPTLVREITTPSLPAFIQSSLQILSSSAPPALVQTVLESFNELLPKHPNIFRSYLKQLQPLLAHLIAPTPSSKLGQEQDPGPNSARTSQVMHAARQLYVQIPCCAPKGASGEGWSKSLKSTLNGAHRVADRVFRAVLEDWQPAMREEPVMSSHMLDDEVQGQDEDSMGLPLWSGIFAGGERLAGLLRLLKEYLESPTTNAVLVNLAAIMDLIARILALNAPGSAGKNFQHTTRLNNQVGKEERDNLWLLLPGIHVAATEVLLALVNRSRASTLALDALIIDQLVWVFASEEDMVEIRAACYVLVAILLKRSGATLAKPTIDSLVPLIRACCEDLLPSEVSNGSAKQTSGQAKANGNGQPQATANADTFLIAAKSIDDPAIGLHGLKEAASDLLPVLLTHIRAQHLSDSARARLDRTAILIQHKDAMVASVLNPPPSKKFGKPAASILPLMARSFPQEKVVEAILKPRMPVIRLGEQDVGDEDTTNDLETEDGIVAEEEGPDKEDDHFVGQALDTLLSAEQTDGVLQDFTMRITSRVGADAASLEANEPENMKNDPFSVAKVVKVVDIGKRALSDHALPSPSKRVKTSVDEQPMPHPTQPTSIIATSLKDIPTNEPLLTTSELTTTSRASMVPESPKVRLGDMESDDDDVGPLVLGPDTDDESE